MKNSMVMFIFSAFDRKYTSLDKFDPKKSKLSVSAENC